MTTSAKVSAPSTTQLARPLHGLMARMEDSVPLGTVTPPGRFGRLFGFLPPLLVPDAALDALGAAMIAPENPGGLDNPDVPAGFTYLGQFIDHDLTFDPTPVPEMAVDPLAIFNFRTPRLDLDSLYGLGPAQQPYLYDRESRAKFLIGRNPESTGVKNTKIKALDNDLPRNSDGFALIGDPRNDENLIVAQLHLAFLKFHNAVIHSLEPDARRQRDRFDEARRIVTWHYQWIIVHEFLPLLLQPEAVQAAFARRSLLRFDKEPYIPVEFSVAAYRFGHTMVRDTYSHNHVFGFDPDAVAPATLRLLFFFTGPDKSRSVPVPSNWAIDWRRFFDFNANVRMNFSRRMDPLLAAELHRLSDHRKVEGPPSSLAVRNLRRGQRVGLPSGQSIAKAIGAAVLAPAQIEDGSADGAAARQHGMLEETPLWYYLLKEAQVMGEGKRLGPVGSTIVAETFAALLAGDPTSFVAQHPSWVPTLPGGKDFGMADLLRFADASSPTINATQDLR